MRASLLCALFTPKSCISRSLRIKLVATQISSGLHKFAKSRRIRAEKITDITIWDVRGNQFAILKRQLPPMLGRSRAVGVSKGHTPQCRLKLHYSRDGLRPGNHVVQLT